MKILKVYDKINRTTFESDLNTGSVFIREYLQNDESYYFIINTKVFKGKRDKMAYFSYVRFKLGKIVETLDLTSKNIYYKTMNEKGLLVHSERIHLKDNKAVLLIDRIYDEADEFIEIENHRGNKTMKFTVKNEILNQLISQK